MSLIPMPARSNSIVIRQFQSETDLIREAREPMAVRFLVWACAAPSSGPAP